MLNSNIEVETAVSMPDHLLRALSQYPAAINKTNWYYIFLELAQYFHSRNVCMRVFGTTVYYSSII